MAPLLTVWLAALGALIVGGLMGWLMGTRRASAFEALLREQTADLTEVQNTAKYSQARLEDAIRELGQQSVRASQAESLRDALECARTEKSKLESQLAASAATAQAKADAVAQQIAQLTALRTDTETKFAELAQAALNSGAQNFLMLANQSFEKQAQSNVAQLEQKKLELDGLLSPLKETLSRYELKLGEVEKERADAYGGLRALVADMKNNHDKVTDQTSRLANALRGSAKMRGNWGEQQLRNVLEKAGLSAFSDFRTEVSVDTEEGRLRPDVIVRLPGGRELVIDAKVSLAAYQASTETDDETAKDVALKAHAKAMRQRAEELGRKAYWDKFASTADYVIMFVPGEHFVNAAMDVDPELWDHAFSRGVLIASPTNLIALARTVAQSWQQARMSEDATKIAELAKDLFKRLATMGDKVVLVGKRLQLAVEGYNEFVGSLEASVMPQARKFRDMEIGSAEKQLPEIESLSAQVRTPVPGRDLLLTSETQDR
jgi:DNA recombination protein RmuC